MGTFYFYFESGENDTYDLLIINMKIPWKSITLFVVTIELKFFSTESETGLKQIETGTKQKERTSWDITV